jgi:hypothetical protein
LKQIRNLGHFIPRKFFVIIQKKIIGKFNTVTQIVNKTLNNNGAKTDPCGGPDTPAGVGGSRAPD